jgi:two-component system NarL family sensor kinase
MNRLTQTIGPPPPGALEAPTLYSDSLIKTAKRTKPAIGRSTVARQVTQFVLAGLVALVVLTLASLIASRRVGTEEAIRDAKDRTAVLSRTIIEEQLTPELLAGDPAALNTLDRRMNEIFVTEAFLHIRLWAPDGRIIYSDEEGLSGAFGELSVEAQEAFATQQVIAEVSELDEAENVGQREEGRLLEVYQPVAALDGTPILFETYDSFASVNDNARQIWWNFLPAVLIPLALLQLIQIPFAVRLARKVERAQNERAELLERVITSSDAERKGIAHDLHDGAVQDLAGVGYALSVVSERASGNGDARSVELLDGVQVDVRRSIKSLRSLFVEIYPPNLQRSGLFVALSDLLAALGGRGIDAKLGYPEGLELGTDTDRVLYRVAQEATRNVVRHADATKLDMEISDVPGGVTLRVIDNGLGFDVTDSENGNGRHFGLRIMKDLAVEAGGHLDIYSKPGVGTDLRLQLPR